jgi:hypothetical protein
VAAVWALVVDIDEGFTGGASGLSESLKAIGKSAITHTTWSHTPRQLKARVVFPFDCECPVEKWPEVWRAGQRWAATWGAKVDAACKDPSRLYFLPASRVDRAGAGTFFHEVVEGNLLSWRWLLSSYAEPAPVVPLRPRLESAGMGPRRLEQATTQRRRFALAFLDRRADHVANAGAGARNQTLYGNARACGRHIVAGILAAGEVRASLAWAGVACGLSVKEADQTITNGLAKSEEDGPWIY